MSKIFEFDPQIYPTRLWVCVNPSFDDVNDKFYFLDDKSENIIDDYSRKDFEKHFLAVATSFSVVDKKSAFKGIFVAIWKKKCVGCGVIAHESTHATDWLWEQLDMRGYSFNEGEPRAYYTQWVANSIAGVLKSKEK